MSAIAPGGPGAISPALPVGGRFVRRVLPALLAGLLAAVVLVDLATWLLLRGDPSYRLPQAGGIRFAPASVVADLRAHAGPPPGWLVGAGYELVTGWGDGVGAGRWLAGEAAELELAGGGRPPVELVVRARSVGPARLAAALDGRPLGSRELAGDGLEVRRWPLPAGLAAATPHRIALSVSGSLRPRGPLLVSGVALAAEADVPWLELARPAVVLDDGTGTVALRRPGRLELSIPPTAAAHELRLEYRFVAADDEPGWPVGRGAVRLAVGGEVREVAVLDAARRLHARLKTRLGASHGDARLEVVLTELTPGAVLVIDDPVVVPGTDYLTDAVTP